VTHQTAIGKVLFPNLNGLRFIAAAVVIIHHVEQLRALLGLPNHRESPFVELIGRIGVTLFFVLSGYLITYLLLVEKHNHGKISIGKFYMRRALRIWPLYFFIVVLSLFVLPEIGFLHIPVLTEQVHDSFLTKLLLYLFFLPNVVLAVFPLVPYASQLWSIGYEEQFYLVWPWILQFVKRKYAILIFIILFFVALRIFSLVYADEIAASGYEKAVSAFFMMPGIDCIAIGGFFAYMLYRRNPLLEKCYSKPFQYVLYAVTIGLILGGVVFPLFNNQVYAVLFGLIVLNLSANPASVITLENKKLNYLGSISYGIYMYHVLVIVIVLKTFTFIGISNTLLVNATVILLTVGAAGLSYKFLEERFIRIKAKKFRP
jgi:peptidoglycan/LPS O-acetylase OafA/YrhL